MPNVVPINSHLYGDVFPFGDWNNAANVTNFLTSAGAALTAAATITVTHEYHFINGNTQINTITHAAPVVGQTLRLRFNVNCAIGVSGNIRTAQGVTTIVGAPLSGPGASISFVWDGTFWRQTTNAAANDTLIWTLDAYSNTVGIAGFSTANAAHILCAPFVVRNSFVGLKFHWHQPGAAAGNWLGYVFSGYDCQSVGLTQVGITASTVVVANYNTASFTSAVQLAPGRYYLGLNLSSTTTQ